jgi:hypothetical protein
MRQHARTGEVSDSGRGGGPAAEEEGGSRTIGGAQLIS